VPDRTKRLAVGLAAFQVVDAAANEIPRRYVATHLDHLGVPARIRPLLPFIKVTSSAGLLLGIKRPRVGAVTAAALVAYYAAAVRVHLLAGDHPLLAAPAALCGATAAITLVDWYLPATVRT
jgi:hypothetical protein